MINKSFAFIVVGLMVATVFAGCTGGNIFGGESGLAGFIPADLKCEYMPNPLGVDTIEPRFSWEMEHDERGQAQSAYQIIVSSTEKNLENEIGDKWDSGKVDSSDQIEIIYTGSALSSSELCFWKVKLWDGKGRESSWSEPSQFTMGLLNANDWQGKWIGGGNMLRKEFTLDKEVKRATAYVTGLGYYELHINGEKVGDHVLDPGWTYYPTRVLYSTYDVTDMVKKGQNAAGAMLGEGHYIQKAYSSNTKFILQLNIEFTDGSTASIVSDPSWKVTSDGPIVSTHIYNGETYDATKELPGWDNPGFDDSKWAAASEVNDACGTLVSYVGPPIRVTNTIVPISMTNPQPGLYVYDMGQNFAGWIQLFVEGPRGTKVTMKHAEVLFDNGTLNQGTLRTAVSTDNYTLKGEGLEVWEPRFTQHGFRYVSIEGYPGTPTLDSIRGRFVHSDVEQIGNFACSNPLLNQMQSNMVWGQASNLMSIPTDCCQRDERLGWTGDAQLNGGECAYNFDVAAFQEKYANDFKDIQDIRGDGQTGNVVPDDPTSGYDANPTDPIWGCAYLILPWENYLKYGDTRVLEQHYEGMKKWMDWLASISINNIVMWSLYGDWCPPTQSQDNLFGGIVDTLSLGTYEMIPFSYTVPQLSSTFVYYEDALVLSQIAEILGHADDAQKYSTLAESIRSSFNTAFYNSATGAYLSAPSVLLDTIEIPDILSQVQTPNSVALYYDMPDEAERPKVLAALLDDIEAKDYHFWTGLLGAHYILQTLTNHGRADVAYTIASQKTYPSFGYMVEQGATTIWERWEAVSGSGMNSHNHMMLAGGIGSWFYSALAGINIDPEKPAYEHIIIKPNIVGDLTYAEGSVDSVRGLVSSRWEKNADSITMEVTIPANSVATVYVPTMRSTGVTITENGTAVLDSNGFNEEIPGIYSASTACPGYVMFESGSGEYLFEVTW